MESHHINPSPIGLGFADFTAGRELSTFADSPCPEEFISIRRKCTYNSLNYKEIQIFRISIEKML